MLLRSIAILALLAANAAAAAQAPEAATSAAPAEVERYRFDLARNFFASPETEVAARAEVEAAADDVVARAAALATPSDMLAAFEAEDRMQRLFRRHDLYLFLRFATDIRREDGLAAADALRGRVRAARLALRRAVVARDQAWITRAIAEQPALARYAFWIETMRREAPHLLSADGQAAATALEPALGAGDYPRVVSGLSFAPVIANGAALDVQRDGAAIETHASPEVRAAGTRALFAGYAAQRDLLAYMLVRAIEGSNAPARLRGHGSAIDEASFDAWVTSAHYEGVLAEIAAHADFYKAWQRRTGDPFAVPQRWSPSEAAAAIAAAAAPIGPEYAAEFAALLDPANGRADLAGGEHRLPMMGTASVYPTGQSAIYMGGFEETLLDLVVLAHEGGHAVQAQLMHASQVPMAYAAGPGYFTESFGRFQELLLLDHLHRNAATPEERARMRDAFAARLLAVFASGEEAAVELALHRAVAEGARTADELDAATAAAGARYSIEYERTPERRGLWMLSEGYFMAPMQELNDAYASLLAIRYFQLYRRDPERFRAGYLALLSGGFDGEPGELLQRHLGLEMMTPEFVRETMAALRDEVDALYR